MPRFYRPKTPTLGRMRPFAITAVPAPVLFSNGDIMPFEEWVEAVQCGMFIDYDGYGVWSDGAYIEGGQGDLHPDVWEYLEGAQLEPSHCAPVLDSLVRPSDYHKGTLVRPDWATHVLWYNR